MLHCYQDYWCSIQERCLATRVRNEPSQPQLRPPVCVGNPIHCEFPIDGDVLNSCPFGIEFAQTVRTYLRVLHGSLLGSLCRCWKFTLIFPFPKR